MHSAHWNAYCISCLTFNLAVDVLLSKDRHEAQQAHGLECLYGKYSLESYAERVELLNIWLLLLLEWLKKWRSLSPPHEWQEDWIHHPYKTMPVNAVWSRNTALVFMLQLVCRYCGHSCVVDAQLALRFSVVRCTQSTWSIYWVTVAAIAWRQIECVSGFLGMPPDFSSRVSCITPVKQSSTCSQPLGLRYFENSPWILSYPGAITSLIKTWKVHLLWWYVEGFSWGMTFSSKLFWFGTVAASHWSDAPWHCL